MMRNRASHENIVRAIPALSVLLCSSMIVSAGTKVDILTLTLPEAGLGQFYSFALSATGGASPYYWSLQNGQLPPGITLSSTGQFSGRGLALGTYSFRVQLIDSAGMHAGQALKLVVASALAVTTVILPTSS